jgi:hypothetical protein
MVAAAGSSELRPCQRLEPQSKLRRYVAAMARDRAHQLAEATGIDNGRAVAPNVGAQGSAQVDGRIASGATRHHGGPKWRDPGFSGRA